MHGRADGRRRDKHVAFDGRPLIGIGDDEAVAVAVHGQAAGDEVLTGGGVLGQSVAVAAGFDELGTLHQGAQTLGELVSLLPAESHLTDKLFVARRMVGLALDVLENGLIGKHFLQ